MDVLIFGFGPEDRHRRLSHGVERLAPVVHSGERIWDRARSNILGGSGDDEDFGGRVRLAADAREEEDEFVVVGVRGLVVDEKVEDPEVDDDVGGVWGWHWGGCGERGETVWGC